MKSIKVIDKNKKLIATVLIAAICYARGNCGYVYTWAVVLNLVVDLIAFIYCTYLYLEDKKFGRKAVLSSVVLWSSAFFLLELIYHFKGMGYFFSTRTTLLTIGAALLIYFILRQNKGYTTEIVTNVGEIVIMGTFAASLYLDRWALYWWKQGIFYRVGLTFSRGNVIETANIYMIMLVPIMYTMVVEKKWKRYIPITLLTWILVFLSASKSTMAAVAFVFAFLLVFGAESKKDLVRNIIIILVIGGLGLLLMFKVPFFYDLVGVRVEEFVVGIKNVGQVEYDLTESTGQRFAAMDAALEHWDEKPVFGHGFYNFCQQEYSLVEGHINNMTGEVTYENMQIHMNFLELLFSFGIFGVLVYYWFPIYLIIKSIRCKVKQKKLLSLLILITMFTIDLGLDMYYKYIIPYYAYGVVYCLLKEAHEK